MDDTDASAGMMIDLIEGFGREEGWFVQRTGIDEMIVARETSSLPVTHGVTALADGMVRIVSTIDLPLPPRRRVMQSVLPDPNVTFAGSGAPMHSLMKKIALTNLGPMAIDQMFVDAENALAALFEP